MNKVLFFLKSFKNQTCFSQFETGNDKLIQIEGHLLIGSKNKTNKKMK